MARVERKVSGVFSEAVSESLQFTTRRGNIMALQGFDVNYYLGQKLALLQSQSKFATEWSAKSVQDLKGFFESVGLDPEYHYQKYGWLEGLTPNSFFNPREYVEAKAVSLVESGAYQTVEAAKAAFNAAWDADPYEHYLMYGWREGVNPSAAFDALAYLEDKLALLQKTDKTWVGKTVEDLTQVFADFGLTPLTHYLQHGEKEGLVHKAVAAKPDSGQGEGAHGDDGTGDGSEAHGDGGPSGGVSVVEIKGSEAADRLTGGNGENNRIYGYDGDDVLRGGDGVDEIYAGDGDDRIVVVGDLRGGGKIDSAEDTTVLGVSLSSYNGLDFNEDEDGSVEIIDGGDGVDTLYVYGTADISHYDLTSVEHVVIRSDVTFDADFIEGLASITGDGSSVVRIRAMGGEPVSINLSELGITLKDIGMLDIGENVTLIVDDVDDLGGATTLIGDGVIEGTASLDLTGITASEEITLRHADGTAATGATVISGAYVHGDGSTPFLTGTDEDDIIDGSDLDEILDGLKGKDVLAGGAGDDIFIVKDSGEKTILDTNGIDTLDFSDASGAADIDLKTGGTVGGVTTVALGSGEIASAYQPIDMFLLQDLSGSFGDDVATVQGLLEGDDGLVANIRDIQPDTNFGVGSFIDKPVSPFGDDGDYVYQTNLPIARDEDEFVDAVNNMSIGSGFDGPEAQLEALYQTALRADEEIGFRDGALRFVLLTTDAEYHQAGDFTVAGGEEGGPEEWGEGDVPEGWDEGDVPEGWDEEGSPEEGDEEAPEAEDPPVIPENNGDTVLDGEPAGTGEDYPSVEMVAEAVKAANIFPVFAVTEDVIETYEELVDNLGVGHVVELSSDSDNIIDVIEEAVTSIDRAFIDRVVGTDFDDKFTVNSLDNFIDGGDGKDQVVFSGNSDEYTMSVFSESTTGATGFVVEDTVDGRDGVNTMISVEELVFNDVFLTGVPDSAGDDVVTG